MRAVEQLLGLRAVGGLYQPLSRRRAASSRRAGAQPVASRQRLPHRPARGSRAALAGGRVVRAAPPGSRRGRRGELRARPQTCGFATAAAPIRRSVAAGGDEPSRPTNELALTDEQQRATATTSRRRVAAIGGRRKRQDVGAGGALRGRRARGRDRALEDPRDHVHRSGGGRAARAGPRAAHELGARDAARDVELTSSGRFTPSALGSAHAGAARRPGPRLRDPRRRPRRPPARARVRGGAARVPGRRARRSTSWRPTSPTAAQMIGDVYAQLRSSASEPRHRAFPQPAGRRGPASRRDARPTLWPAWRSRCSTRCCGCSASATGRSSASAARSTSMTWSSAARDLLRDHEDVRARVVAAL